MSRAVPPMCTVAKSGAALLWESADRAGLIDLGGQELVPSGEWSGVDAGAISPSGNLVALASDETVEIRARDAGWEVVATHEIPFAPFRLAVSDDAVVVVVSGEDSSAPSSLVVLDDEERFEHSLGEATPFTLLLDSEWGRILVSGSAGPGSFHGRGVPFLSLFGRDELDGQWSMLWNGRPSLDGANGWVMPLGFGEIGVHSLERFIVIAPHPTSDGVGSIVDTYEWDHLENVVSSPTGEWLAWFWQEGESGKVVRVRSVRLADVQIVDHPSLDDAGQFPVISVDDDGMVTFVDVLRPNDVRVRWIESGEITAAVHPVQP